MIEIGLDKTNLFYTTNNNNLLLIRRKYLYEYIQMRLTSYMQVTYKLLTQALINFSLSFQFQLKLLLSCLPQNMLERDL